MGTGQTDINKIRSGKQSTWPKVILATRDKWGKVRWIKVNKPEHWTKNSNGTYGQMLNSGYHDGNEDMKGRRFENKWTLFDGYTNDNDYNTYDTREDYRKSNGAPEDHNDYNRLWLLKNYGPDAPFGYKYAGYVWKDVSGDDFVYKVYTKIPPYLNKGDCVNYYADETPVSNDCKLEIWKDIGCTTTDYYNGTYYNNKDVKFIKEKDYGVWKSRATQPSRSDSKGAAKQCYGTCGFWEKNPTQTNISNECLEKIWRDKGCTTPQRYDTTWGKSKTLNQINYDANAWATMNDETHRLGCYGNDPCGYWDKNTNATNISNDCLKKIWGDKGCTTPQPYDTTWGKSKTQDYLKSNASTWATTNDDKHKVGCYGTDVCGYWKNNPNATNISDECLQKLWKDKGCTTTRTIGASDKSNTYSHRSNDYGLWSTMEDDAHRIGCYGVCGPWDKDRTKTNLSTECRQKLWEYRGCSTKNIYSNNSYGDTLNYGQMDYKGKWRSGSKDDNYYNSCHGVCGRWENDDTLTTLSQDCKQKIWEDEGCTTPSRYLNTNNWTNSQHHKYAKINATDNRWVTHCYGACEPWRRDNTSANLTAACVTEMWNDPADVKHANVRKAYCKDGLNAINDTRCIGILTAREKLNEFNAYCAPGGLYNPVSDYDKCSNYYNSTSHNKDVYNNAMKSYCANSSNVGNGNCVEHIKGNINTFNNFVVSYCEKDDGNLKDTPLCTYVYTNANTKNDPLISKSKKKIDIEQCKKDNKFITNTDCITIANNNKGDFVKPMIKYCKDNIFDDKCKKFYDDNFAQYKSECTDKFIGKKENFTNCNEEKINDNNYNMMLFLLFIIFIIVCNCVINNYTKKNNNYDNIIFKNK